MNGLSSVTSNYYSNNYYVLQNNNVLHKQRFEPENDTVKTVAAAGLLQAFAMFLQKASQWCEGKLMQGKEFTTAENIKQTVEKMVNDNNLNVKVDYIDQSNIKNYPPNMIEMLKPVALVGSTLLSKSSSSFFCESSRLSSLLF